MPLYFDISGNQIDGARDYQEDAFMITQLGDSRGGHQDALIIMADGMGGHAAGNVASNLATSTFNKSFAGKYPTDDVATALKDSLMMANDAIGAAVSETPALQGMGCTMVAVFVTGNQLWWVSVGDSHLYVIRERGLTKHNADHSYGGYLRLMKEQGIEVDPDPKLSPNMLMSAMIGDDIAEIDCPSEPVTLQPGDRILVASDGLDTLGQGAIIQYSAWSENARDTVEALLQAVTEANQPRQDNTTIIALDVREEAAAAAPPPAAEPEVDEADDTTQPDAVKKAAAEPAPAEPEEIVMEDALPLEDEQAMQEKYQVVEEEEHDGGGNGAMIAIIAIVVVAVLGAGGYFLFAGGDDKPAAPPAAVADNPPAAPEPVPETEVPVTPAPAPEPVPEPAAVPAAGPVAGTEIVDTLKSGGKGPAMLVLPAGEFTMGGRASALQPDERPQHAVKVDAIAFAKYETTFAEYDKFARATGRKLPRDSGWKRETHPVVFVSWDDAYAYAGWLSKQTGKTYRLPSEAEWEYAARAGTDTDFWWGRSVGVENAHCFDCESGLHPRKPAKVGFFKANPFGIYDTAGNVSEWVHDCYHPNYKGAPDTAVVWEGGDCTKRVIRGGSYSSSSSALRSAKRDKVPSTGSFDNIGIRLVRELD